MAAAFPQRPPRQRRTNAANGLPRHQEQSLARHATENIPYLVLDARLLSWYVVRGRAQSARPKSIPALAAPVELTTTRHPGLHEPPPTAQAPSHDSVAPSITRSGRHPGSPTYKYVTSVEFTSYSYTSTQLGPQIPHLAVQADALRILGMLGLLTYMSQGAQPASHNSISCCFCPRKTTETIAYSKYTGHHYDTRWHIGAQHGRPAARRPAAPHGGHIHTIASSKLKEQGAVRCLHYSSRPGTTSPFPVSRWRHHTAFSIPHSR